LQRWLGQVKNKEIVGVWTFEDAKSHVYVKLKKEKESTIRGALKGARNKRGKFGGKNESGVRDKKCNGIRIASSK